jgi:hypothetical protein
MIERRSGLETGVLAGNAAKIPLPASDDSIRENDILGDVVVGLPSFGTYRFRGNHIVSGAVRYTASFAEIDDGRMHIWDRNWWNMSFTDLRIGPFLAGGMILDGQDEGRLHASAGLEASAQIQLLEYLPLNVELRRGVRLTDDRKNDFAIAVGSQFSF